MKKEVSPAVVWAIIGVVLVVVIIVGFKMLRTPSNFDTKGSEEAMKKVQAGQPLYTPPGGMPSPGVGFTPPGSTRPTGGGPSAMMNIPPGGSTAPGGQ